MLAMNLRTLRGIWRPALSLTTIASMLAPTGSAPHRRDEPGNAAGYLAPSVIVREHREQARSCRGCA